MGALEGRVAVITGATSGIGARTAMLFAAEGADVVLAGRRQAEGEALAASTGGVFLATDVTVESDVQALVAHTVERFDRLDVMISSAGTPGAGGSIAEVDTDRFRRTFDVHVGGVLVGMKHAARVMLAQGSGSIINIASITGRQGGWAGLDYSAAKAAVIHLTRCAAVELGEHGIRVNSISPGPIPTGIFGKGAGMDPARADRTAGELEPAFEGALSSYQPIRRVGATADVAQAALWLASDAASFITGQDLAIDGGITAGRPASVAIAERSSLAAAFAGLAA